jgi:hypothetical protein
VYLLLSHVVQEERRRKVMDLEDGSAQCGPFVDMPEERANVDYGTRTLGVEVYYVQGRHSIVEKPVPSSRPFVLI